MIMPEIDPSKIDLEFVKNYLKIEQDFTEDDTEISMYMIISRDYLAKRCDMTIEEYNKSTILVIPTLMLISSMYLNKSATIASNTKINSMLDRFITIESKVF